VPRFNEFRRQYGCKQLTSFDDFVDHRLAQGSPERREQERLVGVLREVYGRHTCDASKIITSAQVNRTGVRSLTASASDGSLVDNIEERRYGWWAGSRNLRVPMLRHLRDPVPGLYPERVPPAVQRPILHPRVSGPSSTPTSESVVTDNGPDGKSWRAAGRTATATKCRPSNACSCGRSGTRPGTRPGR